MFRQIILIIIIAEFTTLAFSNTKDYLIVELKSEYQKLDSLHHNSVNLKESIGRDICDIKNRINNIKKELKTLSNELDNPVYFDNNIYLDQNVDLSDFYVYEYTSTHYQVFARLKNKQQKYLEWVKLRCDLYLKGSFVSTDYAYIEFETYGYSGISPYKNSFINTYLDKVDFDSIGYEVEYDIENGDDDIMWDQLLQLKSVAIQPYGSLKKWQGVVSNNYNYSMKFPNIYACIMKNGKMIGFDYAFLDVDTLYFNSLIIQYVTTSPTSSEQVVLKNYSNYDINISDWTIGDLNDPTAYKIPQGTIIYSGLTKTFTHIQLGFQINDTGEVIYLKNQYGFTVDFWNASIGIDREYKNNRFKENSVASFSSYIDLPAEYDTIKYYLNYYLHSFDGDGNIPPNIPIFLNANYDGFSFSDMDFDVFVIDPNGDHCNLLMDYNDGTTMNWEGNFTSDYNATVQHSFDFDGQYFIKAKARDEYNLETEWSELINVNISPSVEPQIIHSDLDSAHYRNSYVAQLKASGGIKPYSWQITNGSLPYGLLLNSTTGQIGGLPVVSGSFNFDVMLRDAGTPSLSDTSSFNLFVINNHPVITSDDTLITYTNTAITYAASANDLDGNSITFDFANYQTWLSKTSTTLYGTTPNTPQETSFLVIATDGDLNDTLNVTIIINAQEVCQTLNFNQGWNMISINVTPANPNISVVMASIAGKLVIVKDSAGKTYIPMYGIDDIGIMQFDHGYQAYVAEAVILDVNGIPVDPTKPISLPAGWSIISYLPAAPMNVTTALANIGSKLVIAKNNAGQTYIPVFGINDIGNMIPGQGYQVYVNSAVTLIYPSSGAFNFIQKMIIMK